MKIKTIQSLILLFGIISICQSLPQGRKRFARDVEGMKISSLSNEAIKFKESVKEGMGVPKEAIEKVNSFMVSLQEMIKKVHEDIKRINLMAKDLSTEGDALSQAYYHEFYPIRTNLRNTRLGLRSLAEETIIMTRNVRALFKSSERLGNKRALELQMGELEALIDKSIPILQMADKEYRASIAKLEKLEPIMNTLVAKLNRLLDRNSDEHAAYAKTLRGGAYGGAAAGSGIMIALDAAGCLGLCFSIYNAVAWPATVAAVELSLNERMNAIENLKWVAQSILQTTNGLSGNMDESINFLEKELGIIQRWRSEVNNVKRHIDTFPLEEIPLVKDIFVTDMDGLQAAAQRFLDQPEAVFADTEKMDENLRKKAM